MGTRFHITFFEAFMSKIFFSTKLKFLTILHYLDQCQNSKFHSEMSAPMRKFLVPCFYLRINICIYCYLLSNTYSRSLQYFMQAYKWQMHRQKESKSYNFFRFLLPFTKCSLKQVIKSLVTHNIRSCKFARNWPFIQRLTSQFAFSRF